MFRKVLVMSESLASAAGTLTLGSDLVVTRLGYGAMRLTGSGMWGEYPDRAGGIALLKHVVEAGVMFIDTADAYGPHTNEVLIHDALSPYPDDLVIATKGGVIRGGPELSVIRITLGICAQQRLESWAFPRELAYWDEASRIPVWRPGCYASSPNGANVWTTSYMPGSNVAMASASWRNGSGARSWRMA